MGFQFPRHEQRVRGGLVGHSVEHRQAARRNASRRPLAFRPVPRSSIGRRARERHPLYDYRTGVWVASQKPSEMWLRFQTPEAVLPLQLQRARLTLQITAPSRTVEILRYVGNRRQPLHRRTIRSGTSRRRSRTRNCCRWTPTAACWWGSPSDRRSKRDTARRREPWKIEMAQLEIAGVVLPGPRD